MTMTMTMTMTMKKFISVMLHNENVTYHKTKKEIVNTIIQSE